MNNEVKAGLFIFISLALFVSVVMVLGKERQIFAKQVEYYTIFGDVGGLADGAPVRLGGINIGRVDEITFSKNFQEPGIRVRLLINENFLERIRKDTLVSIQTQGLLGDKFVSLSTSTNIEQALPGAILTSKDPSDFAEVLNKAGEVVDNITSISGQAEKAFSRMNTDLLPDISKAAKGIAKISEEMDSGKGLLHRLIYSSEDADAIISSVKDTSKALRNIMTAVEKGEGFLHAAIYDPKGKNTLSAFSSASTELSKAITEIAAIGNAVKSGNGLAHEIIYGEAPTLSKDLTAILESLKIASKNFEEASRALANGDGTLGALLVDASLYNNLVEVSDEAKRSFILKSAIKSAIDK